MRATHSFWGRSASLGRWARCQQPHPPELHSMHRLGHRAQCAGGLLSWHEALAPFLECTMYEVCALPTHPTCHSLLGMPAG